MADDHASSREQETAARRIRVLLPLPLPEALDYLGPEGSSPPEPGSFVNVPLGQRSLTGVVWDGAGEELPADRLKPIIETLPTPRLQPPGGFPCPDADSLNQRTNLRRIPRAASGILPRRDGPMPRGNRTARLLAEPQRTLPQPEVAHSRDESDRREAKQSPQYG